MGITHVRSVRARLGAVVVAVAALLGTQTAHALPVAPEPVAPVTGIPQPCPSEHPWPGDDVGVETITAQLTETFGLALAGRQWSSANIESIKILWQTLDALNCTDYLPTIQAKTKGRIGLNADRISGYAWGDWSLTRANHVTFDFAKFEAALAKGDEGRLVRLVVHELAHAWSTDRYSGSAQYWSDFQALRRAEGRFSDYARGSTSEIFADVVGYYVGRCALDNPYDSGEHTAYYEFARDVVFGGKEFGPEPGTTPECSVPAADATEPQPGNEDTSWVEALVSE